MSRTLKRVPLDFNWPLGKVWEGYVNPHGKTAVDCAACDRSGYAPRAKLFDGQWYGTAHFDAAEYGAEPLPVDHPAIVAFAKRNVGRAPQFYTRAARDNFPFLTTNAETEMETRRLHELFSHQWMHNLIQADVDALVAADRLAYFTRNSMPRPTAAEVNDWSMRGGIGHDSINAHACIRARCEREGSPVTCAECGGRGYTISPEDEAARDAWVKTEPPAGEGYQLWEDVSEGSPQSPVFATLDDLCAWCEENATTFAHFRASAAEWKKMLEEDNVHAREGNMIFV